MAHDTLRDKWRLAPFAADLDFRAFLGSIALAPKQRSSRGKSNLRIITKRGATRTRRRAPARRLRLPGLRRDAVAHLFPARGPDVYRFVPSAAGPLRTPVVTLDRQLCGSEFMTTYVS